MLYLIGLGLGDAKDITVKGLEVVRRCSRVYLEAYTSVLTVGKEALEEFYGRKLILADREEVEQEADNILKDADVSDVAFLVVGDPFGIFFSSLNNLIFGNTAVTLPALNLPFIKPLDFNFSHPLGALSFLITKKMGFYLSSQTSSISDVKPNRRALCLQLVTQDLCHRFEEHKDN